MAEIKIEVEHLTSIKYEHIDEQNELQETSHHQFELIEINQEYTTDYDECDNNDPLSENIKTELKHEDLDIPCDCPEHNVCDETTCNSYQTSYELNEEINKDADSVEESSISNCKRCMKMITHASELKKYYETQTGQKAHDCTVCGKWFTEIEELKSHESEHRGETPHVCTELTETPTKKPKHICNLCGKVFLFASILKQHEQSHTRVKQHMRTHSGEKPYACTKCSFRSVQASHITEHMRSVHEENKRRQNKECKLCPEICNQKIHKRLRRTEKLHSCANCKKRFPSASALEKHVWIHTDENSFACTKCRYKCKQASDLKKHVHRRH